MSRTKGSGWGGGVLLYQKHRACGKKKAIYDPIPGSDVLPFKCVRCKRRFYDTTLLKYKYVSQIVTTPQT